ncbi:hypothetical protein LTR48_000633 [Friedmanniomyces endolithicus]|uniref:Glycoside hydrolase family 5 domain-containing protein n=1 Tax=Rachicladosporium monterosium TaxID=1507873 RepID=A0ABR0LGT1_9PEZI|nr:hypothetical protein LTR48_000633 [Friedmanniomyces endolithicus]KAK5148098.1 hypothetical protein LTR32_000553 [Rachicladosporium monterosium]
MTWPRSRPLDSAAIRIPLGYWAVDLLDYEPYVSGQYTYLVQAVQWAKELGLHVMIDLHGAPGSQNGWEETGLVGPIGFVDNSSNSDRSLNVLRNLTAEFTKEMYGGAVTNIELLNEPIFANAALRTFYTAGADVVGPANSSGINVTIHDAFYNPPTWANYDPHDANAQTPGKFLTLDTHQFWAFPPLDKLPEPQILQRICDFAAALKLNNTGIPPTLVGEWSLSTGITANSSSNTEQDQAKRTWFRKLFEAQNAAYSPQKAGQPSIGWYFWSWQTEYDIDAWSYRRGLADGYIPSNISDPSTYAFPVLDNGCIDDSFAYTAAASVSGLGPSSTGSNGGSSATSTGGSSAATTTGSSSTSSSSSSSSTAKSGAPAGVTMLGGLWVSALGVASVLLFCLY